MYIVQCTLYLTLYNVHVCLLLYSNCVELHRTVCSIRNNSNVHCTMHTVHCFMTFTSLYNTTATSQLAPKGEFEIYTV